MPFFPPEGILQLQIDIASNYAVLKGWGKFYPIPPRLTLRSFLAGLLLRERSDGEESHRVQSLFKSFLRDRYLQRDLMPAIRGTLSEHHFKAAVFQQSKMTELSLGARVRLVDLILGDPVPFA